MTGVKRNMIGRANTRTSVSRLGLARLGGLVDLVVLAEMNRTNGNTGSQRQRDAVRVSDEVDRWIAQRVEASRPPA